MAHSRICSIPDCGKPHHARGLCKAHHVQWLRDRNPAQCSIEGCDKPAMSRGWCSAHWHRAYRNNGDPLAGRKPGAKAGEPQEYLRDVVLPYNGEDCLTWPFGRSSGYGKIHLTGGQYLVSRVVCETVNGPPPTARHEAAHSCGKGHEGCVNPRHLSWKTPAENWADKYAHGTDNRGERNGRWKNGKYQRYS